MRPQFVGLPRVQRIEYHAMRLPVYSLLLIWLTLSSGTRADILDTKHNLMGAREAPASAEEKRLRAREVCVFCHTPGVGDQLGDVPGDSADDAGPGRVVPIHTVSDIPEARWQKSVEVGFSYDLFDDIGRIGAEGTGAQPVGSVSLACLSCHDSVQAVGVTQGAASDHPFGVPYRGQFRRAEAGVDRDRMPVSSGDSPSRLAGYAGDDAEFRPARSGVVNKRQVWWAAVTDSGQRTKNDLPLYPRRVGSMDGYEQVPFIECTSCHDPHSNRVVFLRTSSDQSKLCMACHIK